MVATRGDAPPEPRHGVYAGHWEEFTRWSVACSSVAHARLAP